MGYNNIPSIPVKFRHVPTIPLPPRYLLPNFVDFVAGVTHKKQLPQWRADACRRMALPDRRIKVHHIWGKCQLARPLTVRNFVAIRQEVSEISAIKNLCSPKVSQNSPKSLKTCYPLKPPSCHISSRSVKTPRRKPLQKITPFNILALKVDPVGQRSPVS